MVEESLESVVITGFCSVEVYYWGGREVDANHGANAVDNEGVAGVRESVAEAVF